MQEILSQAQLTLTSDTINKPVSLHIQRVFHRIIGFTNSKPAISIVGFGY